MGPIKANLELSNASQASLKSIQVICLVDTGALHLCIPEHVALQLGFDLHSTERRVVTLADGKKHLVAYVGPVKVRFEKRSCYVGA